MSATATGCTVAAMPAAAPRRVLIVGTGLTGSLTCYHLRALSRTRRLPLRIEVADMARGPGGRMSTTRFGPADTRANTGAQYLSAATPKAAALLQAACASSSSCSLDRVADPSKRSTHFTLHADERYTHWLPREGTNSAVKQFLYGGEPDLVVFESRLQRMAVDAASARPLLVPLFDSGGTASAYDVVILAMPPKDIMKFFNNDRSDAQSQADLHRRTNRGKTAHVPSSHRGVVLPPDVLRQLRAPSFVGRYSLVFWFQDAAFAERAAAAFGSRLEPHPVIDMVSAQAGGVLVAQSTVELWRQLNNTRGGGRGPAKASIVGALEGLAGGKMPRAQHTKLLNWRTSQTLPPTGGGVVTAEGGRLVFTGDWCFESSFEGCNLAAEAAAAATINAIVSPAGADAVKGDGEAEPEGEGEGEAEGGMRAAFGATPTGSSSGGGVGGGRVCSGPCGASCPRSAYSKSQWRKPAGSGRCKECVAGTGGGKDTFKKQKV